MSEVKVLVLENCLIKQKHFEMNQKLFLDFDTALRLQKMNRVKILDVDVAVEKEEIEEVEEEVVNTVVSKKPRKQRATRAEKEE